MGDQPNVVDTPDLGWQFAASPQNKSGAYGYSHKEKDMHVSFVASGPYYKTAECSIENAAFQNVDIYPKFSDMLHFRAANTDGDSQKTSILRVR